MILVKVWTLLFRIFYKSLEVEGLENIPKGKPILFVSNHTNAILDPFCIMVAIKQRVMITARSTLASFPFFGLLMKWLGVITFHRSQDRIKNRAKNHNMISIQKCSDAIHQGSPVCIFPEGQSHSDPKLRPFKHGAARIAIDFQQRFGDATPLNIVPVGLFFKNKSSYRSTALVRFNAPIIMPTADPDPPTPRTITNAIEAGISGVTLNFDTLEEAKKIMWCGTLLTNANTHYPLTKDTTNLTDSIKITQALHARYSEFKYNAQVQALETAIDQLKLSMETHGISIDDLFVPFSLKRSIVFTIIHLAIVVPGVPIVIGGTVLHMAQYWVTSFIAKQFTRTQDQWASNMIVIGCIVFPLFYVLYVGISAIVHPALGWAMGLGMPIIGYLSLLFIDLLRFSLRRTIGFFKLLLNPRLKSTLIRSATQIIDDVNRLKEDLHV